MAIAAGSRVNLAIVEEVTRNTTPATNFTTLRYKSENLSLKKETFQSEEHRSDRAISSIRHGMRTVDGNIEVEASVGGHDMLFEGALAGTWAAGTSVSTVTAVASGNKLTRATGSFITDGYLVGDIITISGYATAGNNGTARVTAVAALELTIASTGLFAKTLSNDTGGAVILKGKRLKTGTTLKTYSIEEGFLDVSEYRKFTGCAVNEMTITIQPKQIVSVSFGMIGMDSDAMQSSAFAPGYTASGTNEPLDAYNGGLWEGGVANTIVTGATIRLSNGRSTDGVVGSPITPDIFEGRTAISGTISVFFDDAATYNKFRNETSTNLDIVLKDPNGTDFLRVVVPAIKLNSAEFSVPMEGPVPVSMEFQGYLDSTAGCMMYLQRSNS